MNTPLPLPRGAARIAEARARHQKPAGAVIVSFVGDTPWDAYHVHCEPGKRYRWDWSELLRLVIVVAPGIDASDAIRGCFWPENPSDFLTLIDIQRQQVSCVIRLLPKPVLWHRKDVSDFFPETATCN